MISDLHTADIWTNRLDDACTFVPVNDWTRMRHQTLDVVEIAVAHAACDVANAHLVSLRLLQIEHLDFNALARFVVDRCLDLHGQAILSMPQAGLLLVLPFSAPMMGVRQVLRLSASMLQAIEVHERRASATCAEFSRHQLRRR